MEEPRGDSRGVVIVINEESLAPLAASKGVVSYGFSSITLKVYKCDEKEPEKDTPKPATEEHVPTSQSAVPSLLGVNLALTDTEMDSDSPSLDPDLGSSITTPSLLGVDLMLTDTEMDSDHNSLSLNENDLLSSDSEEANTTVVEVSAIDCSSNAAINTD